MNEQERAEQFTHDADTLLRGETPSSADADDRALLGLARDLLAADFSAETRLDLLRPNLAKPTLKGLIMSPRYRYVRWFVTSAALFTLIVAIILTVPPLRAIAQDILRQIGIYNVTDAPTDAEIAMQPVPSIDLAIADEDTVLIPLTTGQLDAEIATNSSFWRAKLPIIPAGYEVVDYHFVIYEPSSFGYSQTRYTRKDNPDSWFSFQQMAKAPELYPIEYDSGGAQIEEIVVGDSPAVFISGYAEYPEHDIRMLIWEQDYRRMWLIATDLDKERLISMAESVVLRAPENLPDHYDSAQEGLPAIQIAQEVGFEVAVIQKLPPSMSLKSTDVYNDPKYKSTQIVSFYTAGRSSLELHQVKLSNANAPAPQAWEVPVGDRPVEDVVINGQPGVFVENIASFANTSSNVLVWEQNGFSMYLRATELTRNEIFRAAESVTFIMASTLEVTPDKDYAARIISAECISLAFNIPVSVADYLPNGYTIDSRTGRQTRDVLTIRTTYEHVAGDDSLVIIQSKFEKDVSIEDLAAADTVYNLYTMDGGQTAIWMDLYYTYPDIPIRMLLWEQDGFIFQLQTRALNFEEMVRIADNLRHAEPPSC